MGLKLQANLDEEEYPIGKKISDKDLKKVNLKKDEFQTNYQRPQHEDPTSHWEWYDPSGGWMSNNQIVFYGGWTIKLGDD